MRTCFCEITDVNFLSLFIESCEEWSLILVIGSYHFNVRVILSDLKESVLKDNVRLRNVVPYACDLSVVTCVYYSLHFVFCVILYIWGKVCEGRPSGWDLGLPVVGVKGVCFFGSRSIKNCFALEWIEKHSGKLLWIVELSD